LIAWKADESDTEGCRDAEKIFISTLNRRPVDLVAVLQQLLLPCTRRLETAGFNWQHDTGCLIFVHTYQYESVVRALQDCTLRPSHVIFTESLEYLVEDALAQIHERCKTCEEVTVEATSEPGSPTSGTARSSVEEDATASLVDGCENKGCVGSSLARFEERAERCGRSIVCLEKRTFLTYVPRAPDVEDAVQSAPDGMAEHMNPRRRECEWERQNSAAALDLHSSVDADVDASLDDGRESKGCGSSLAQFKERTEECGLSIVRLEKRTFLTYVPRVSDVEDVVQSTTDGKAQAVNPRRRECEWKRQNDAASSASSAM